MDSKLSFQIIEEKFNNQIIIIMRFSNISDKIRKLIKIVFWARKKNKLEEEGGK